MSHSITSHNSRVTVRPSVKEDISFLVGIDEVPFTVKSITFLLDGEVAGIGGVRYENGYYLAFSVMKDDIKVSKLTIARCGLEVIKMIKEVKGDILAVRDKGFDNSGGFLEYLGFQKIEENQDKEHEVYKWLA